MIERCSYAQGIRVGFQHLLSSYPETFVLGQGLWSPWYVGESMKELEVEFGKDRVIDTPVSEQACTGVAVGAAIAGKRPIIVHPRMDFMILAVDQIVTQAAKWSSMFAGRGSAPALVRAIINRGGEQGAQHSQALHSWFSHIPGLRVVMPASVADARDMLVSGTLINDPVLYIDDRWLYELEADIPSEPNTEAILSGPNVVRQGDDLTIVGAGYTTKLATEAAGNLEREGISAEVIDLRILNPLDTTVVLESVKRTGVLLVVDGGWTTCGLAGEIIARVAETISPRDWKAKPVRVTQVDAPAPTSRPLEAEYYPTVESVHAAARGLIESVRSPQA